MRLAAMCLLFLIALPARAAVIVVDVLGDPPPDGCTAGSCSLREAITLANSLPGADTILLPATGELAIQLTIAGAGEDANASGDLDVTDEVEIVGAGPQATRILQTVADRIFHLRAPATLRGMSLIGGDVNGQGGALRAGRRLDVADVDFIGNATSGAFAEGGAIFFAIPFAASPSDAIRLQRVRFLDNASPGAGGAIAIESNALSNPPPMVLEEVDFEANRAGSSGGAIGVYGGINGGVFALSIAGSRFVGNVALGSGGAVGSTATGNVVVLDSAFEANAASDALNGGAIALAGTVGALRSRFEGNRAGSGGAIWAHRVEAIDSEFCDNEAGREGGAILAVAEALIRGSTFCRNDVTASDPALVGGGAVAVVGSGQLLIERSTFDGNSALRGGAISHMSSGDLRIHGATLVAPAFTPIGTVGTALRVSGTVPGAVRDLRNTLVRGSCGFGSADDQWSAAHSNIESSGNGCRFGTAAAGSDNLVGVAAAELQLAALADNGGPTRTRMPQAGSLLVDSGSNADCLSPDQRGFPVTDGHCDIGAVERNAGLVPGERIFWTGFED